MSIQAHIWMLDAVVIVLVVSHVSLFFVHMELRRWVYERLLGLVELLKKSVNLSEELDSNSQKMLGAVRDVQQSVNKLR